MLLDNATTHLISSYGLIAVFLGSVLFGETIIIASAFLAAGGIFPLLWVFIFTFLGTVISDSIWFYFGNNIISLSSKLAKKSEKYKGYLIKLDKFTGNKTFLALLFIKFLYGTRILTIVYLSIKKTGFVKFLLFDIIGTLIWLPIIIAMGWFTAKGANNLISLFNRIEYILAVLVLLIITIRIATSWLTKKIIKE